MPNRRRPQESREYERQLKARIEELRKGVREAECRPIGKAERAKTTVPIRRELARKLSSLSRLKKEECYRDKGRAAAAARRRAGTTGTKAAAQQPDDPLLGKLHLLFQEVKAKIHAWDGQFSSEVFTIK